MWTHLLPPQHTHTPCCGISLAPAAWGIEDQNLGPQLETWIPAGSGRVEKNQSKGTPPRTTRPKRHQCLHPWVFPVGQPASTSWATVKVSWEAVKMEKLKFVLPESTETVFNISMDGQSQRIAPSCGQDT